MAQVVNNVLVVGGGTAGWLSASILARQLNSGAEGAVQVTLVESPDIPIVGVGEGTWPTIRTTLQNLGVDEGEFMRECDATFKQGSAFVNWTDEPGNQQADTYYHPFSAVFHASYDFNLAPYWLLGDADKGVPYDKAVATQSRICEMGLAPKKITTPAYAAIQNYAYHLNANKFADFLAKYAVTKLGVRHCKANVTQVNVDEGGFIASVETDNEQYPQLEADFFIDCSGSKSLLLHGALDVPWLKVGETIFCDTALAMQVPYPTDDTPIATHTLATAQDAGWVWDIGLHNRRGIGHVYSSAHTSHEQAEQVLRAYAGPEGQDLEVRQIPINAGYREKFWHKNCVAIGMAAAFIEPLEASAIFLIEAAANMIADQFPRTRESMRFVEQKYNSTFGLRWQKTIDFIKLHYCISKRRDTEFWRDNCDPKTIPEGLQEKLKHWRLHPPSKFDFDYAYEPFVLDSYLFVLYGMRFDGDISYNKTAFIQHDEAKRRFEEINRATESLAKELPKQRELVEKVYQYGFQSV